MSKELDWTLIPSLFSDEMDKYLNAVDCVRARSVCMAWFDSIKERQNAPLLILLDIEDEDGTIKGLSLFDLVRKEIIPIGPIISYGLPRSYYLGSSHGCIFLGKYSLRKNGNKKLSIILINPFSDEILLNLPSLRERRIGRVFLSQQPFRLPNDNLVVVYYPHHQGKTFYFICPMKEHQWHSFRLDDRPDDVVSIGGHFYANFGRVLSEIDLWKGKHLDVDILLPGLNQLQSSDPAFFLRSFEDHDGTLFLLITSSVRKSTFCFTSVSPTQMGDYDQHLFDPPFHWHKDRFLLIPDELTVKLRNARFFLHDYYPLHLLLRLSAFWPIGWRPGGWITYSSILS